MQMNYTNDELPDNDREVLILTVGGVYRLGWFDDNGDCWSHSAKARCVVKVIAIAWWNLRDPKEILEQ